MRIINYQMRAKTCNWS